VSRAAAPKPLCLVQVGLETLIMPAADAQKLMALLTNAVECDRDWKAGLRERFVVKEQPLRVSIETISASQVVMPESAAPVAAARGQRLRLKGPEG
jgi:hypothetical protein